MKHVIDGPVVRLELSRAEAMALWEFMAPVVASRAHLADFWGPEAELGYMPGTAIGPPGAFVPGTARRVGQKPERPQDALDPFVAALRAAVYEMAGAAPTLKEVS